MVWLLSLPLSLGYFFLGKPLIGIFLEDGTADALGTGIVFLKIVAPFYFVVSAKLVTDGVLRGSGRMGQFMTATFSDLILRVVLAAALSDGLGSIGIWLAWPIGWIVGTGMSLLFYHRDTYSRQPEGA